MHGVLQSNTNKMADSWAELPLCSDTVSAKVKSYFFLLSSSCLSNLTEVAGESP